MNEIYSVTALRTAIVLITILNTVESEELLELKCFNASECKQFQHSGIQANCMEEHCRCINAIGDRVDCKPMERKLNNIIGGACPCYQPNSDCDKEQDTCYCARDFMPSGDKRRCIPKISKLEEDCEVDLQCQRRDYNGFCDTISRRCLCMNLFLNDNGKCVSIVGTRMFCRNNTECTVKFGSNSQCITKSNNCICMDGYISSVDNSSCLKVPKYLENCTENLQCISSMGPGGICSENMCQCDVNYFVEERKSENGTLNAICSPVVKRGQYCRYPEDCYQRKLEESEQSMHCSYGECNCKSGFNSFNDGECIAGDASATMTLGYFVVLGLAVLMTFN